jgi:hypothetical protein
MYGYHSYSVTSTFHHVHGQNHSQTSVLTIPSGCVLALVSPPQISLRAKLGLLSETMLNSADPGLACLGRMERLMTSFYRNGVRIRKGDGTGFLLYWNLECLGAFDVYLYDRLIVLNR